MRPWSSSSSRTCWSSGTLIPLSWQSSSRLQLPGPVRIQGVDRQGRSGARGGSRFLRRGFGWVRPTAHSRVMGRARGRVWTGLRWRVDWMRARRRRRAFREPRGRRSRGLVHLIPQRQGRAWSRDRAPPRGLVRSEPKRAPAARMSRAWHRQRAARCGHARATASKLVARRYHPAVDRRRGHRALADRVLAARVLAFRVLLRWRRPPAARALACRGFVPARARATPSPDARRASLRAPANRRALPR